MFSQKKRTEDRHSTFHAEISEPLLNRSQGDLIGHGEDQTQLLFSVNDDGESDSSSLGSPARQLQPVVRFQEEVQVIGPPLRSTMQSREAGAYYYRTNATRLRTACAEFELDSDNFEASALADSRHDQDRPSSRSRQGRRRPVPLLAGFMDSLTSRMTPEAIIPMYESIEQETVSDSHVDLDEVAAKQWAGGGMFDSVANMANSILGAGKSDSCLDGMQISRVSRYHWCVRPLWFGVILSQCQVYLMQ